MNAATDGGVGPERARIAAVHAKRRAHRSADWPAKHWEAEDRADRLIEELVGLHCDDLMTVTAIAARMGRSTWWVRTSLVGAGVQIRPYGRPPVTDELVDSIVHWYANDYLTVAAIAERVNRSRGWVSAQLSGRGITIRHGNATAPTPHEIVAKWAELYAANHSLESIADRAGVSTGVVRRRLVEHGVTIRSRRFVLAGDELAEFVRLYSEDKQSVRSLANQWGHTAAWARRTLVEAGVQIRPRLAAPVATGDAERAVDLFLEGGRSVKEIAVELAVTPAQVRNVLIASGAVNKHLRGRDLDGQIADLFESTVLTIEQIADELVCSPARVTKTIIAGGLGRRDNGNRLDLAPSVLLGHFENGDGVDQIAARYDVTTTAVQDLIERHRAS